MEKRLFISGGRGGLAGTMATLFAEAGWTVDAPGRAELDMEDRHAIAGWFAQRPPYDLCICNAGVTHDNLLARQREETWDQVMGVNLTGPAWCARSAAGEMKKAGQGHIVLIGSYIAEHPKAGQVLYATSKSALKGLVKSLAMEWGSFNIRVNLVYPGFLETPMTARLGDDIRERARSIHTLKRFNSPEKTASFLLFLQETMSETSGQTFSLDSRLI